MTLRRARLEHGSADNSGGEQTVDIAVHLFPVRVYSMAFGLSLYYLRRAPENSPSAPEFESAPIKIEAC
jgi:hypothetical protein